MSQVVKQESSFNFGKIEAASGNSYVEPGQYVMNITKAEYVQPEGVNQQGNPKTPYVELTFESKMGKVNEKFYVSPGALPRLQYLHEQWFGKKCDKDFKSAEEVGRYFAKVMPMKPEIKKNINVGGTQATNGKVYANLVPFNFVIPDNIPFEEGPFAVGSMAYVACVKMSSKQNSSPTTDDVMLPSTETNSKSDIDDLPF